MADRPNLSEIRNVVCAGLPRATSPLRVGVIGAGMAGLVAALELKRAGHAVTVLEAQTRVGGRILTLREPFSHGLYGEAGAMRIPTGHDLTLAYCERFALPLAPFKTENEDAYVLVGNARPVRRRDFILDPTSGGLDPNNIEAKPTDAWKAAFAPVQAEVARDGLEAVEQRYGQCSLRDFLCDHAKWSERQIEIFGLLSHMESLLDGAFVEILREETGAWFEDVVTIRGGMDQLPAACLERIGDCIRYGQRVDRVRDEAGGVLFVDATVPGHIAAAHGPFDHVIVTVPFSVLRNIDLPASVSAEKRRAIRQVTYDASVKVFLQARERFWEDHDGIAGGASVTDRPIRACYYPLPGRETGRGVLLASYTWGQDAIRWGAMTPQDRVAEAIEDVRELHPNAPIDVFEGGTSKVWHQDPFAGGAFANFMPGQHARLHEAICRPEGRLHFAGEHASDAHAWIQGAIESGLRAALEVHTGGRPGA